MNNKGKVVLYLMRHGQTILNKAGRTQGWCDGVLTKEGIEVAVNVGLGLSDIKFKAAYSSDLGRAIKTAKIILNENRESGNLELKELECLREVCFGKYEGELESVKLKDILNFLNVSSFEEAAKKYDFQKAYTNACAALDETKEAEDYDTALKRVMKGLGNICLENSSDNGGNVLVVTHGGIIRIIINYLDKSFDLRHVDNSSISKIIYEKGTFKVETVNDNSYYEKGKAVKTTVKN
ncbi:histidine phosphatase family protein [Clostridium sp. SYSU_GA19001]|uniref:histidine phosphatase family protein n=1 Tax=Clostridium caldaquaticum TaxID=2940653 RepID=UPI002076F01A|nr:histidine phosphatase family protein [Clostridium caldaquaticum]MCM8710092.1 histidine phosphatase family protein [Clostridium caldaquaticum]